MLKTVRGPTMILWRSILGFIGFAIIFGAIKSCWVHLQCPLCGTYSNIQYQGRANFNVYEKSPDVTYCITNYSPEMGFINKCYTFRLEEVENDDAFNLRVTDKARKEHPAEILFDSKSERRHIAGDVWVCDGTFIGTYDRQVQ
ncbi:hypothetical protein [Burkholderia sp. Ac-20353]|uniref:hypothetical protein n=1 Tax=Burkholderia sp. Ac-20353 TaxID=2703894 RepID=UPI00197B49ED|nr:hypothetical protein [Burkholderia sp. Ac-20353]MBN3786035.1 hypothetical protein [Burkholderia sp. Ac-20353]